MKELFKKAFVASLVAAGLMIVGLSAAASAGIVVPVVVTAAYIAGGLVLLFIPRHRKLGQVLLLAAGMILLVGFSVCSVILATFRVH